jgi:hypothetical protein
MTDDNIDDPRRTYAPAAAGHLQSLALVTGV